MNLFRFLMGSMIHFMTDPGTGGGGGEPAPAEPIPAGGFRASVPTHIDPGVGAPPAGDDFSSKIPEEFRSEKYLEGVNSYEDVFKKLHHAQGLVGKGPYSIPEEGAPQEKIDAFYKALGRPDTSEGYELKGFEEEGKEAGKAIQDLFFKVGLSKKQAESLSEGYNALVQAEIKAKQDADDKAFGELTSKHFGDKKEKVIASAKALIEKFTPESMQGYVEGLPNESLVVLAAVLDGVRSKYIKEDSLGSPNGTGGGMTEQALREEGRKLMASPEYQNAMHPRHDEIVRKVQEIYARIK